ncbi:slit homolog 1 protein-like [Clytia hemisphaerica]|uniref:slit homolog 1 protein-like n=1 Tax=Clytia hemisphaerica TaxID=252671 RepID=UPI0034D56007
MWNFVVLCLLVQQVASYRLCPRQCHCDDLEEFVDCSHANLTSVPKDIPKSVKVLHLDGNQIKKIYRTDFDQFQLLEDLYLHDNPIEVYETYPFSLTRNLRHLSIYISTAVNHHTFWGMNNLEYLEIFGNKSVKAITEDLHLIKAPLQYFAIHGTSISSLKQLNFNNFSQLKELNLTGNAITSLEMKAFARTNLQLLDISHNQFTTLDLSHLPRLTELYATGNELTNITFTDLPSLSEVHLSHNNLTESPNFIDSNIEYLDLSHNQLTEFIVDDCRKLKSLDLSFNPLTKFQASSDSSCLLNFLTLRNTNLKELDLTTMDARSLDLSHNCDLKVMNFSARFEELAMREITMSHSCLVNVPAAFLKGNHIDSLILNNNKISSTLNISVTASYLDLSNNNIAVVNFLIPSSNYDHIDLSNNQLSSLVTTYAITIRELNLSSNQLQEQSKLHFQRIDVTNLDLSHNKLSKANIEGLLDSHFLFDMQSLILSHNQIESLEKVNLKKLTHLSVVDLSYNQISSIEPDTFRYLNSLSKLLLHNNKLTKIPIQMRDFRYLEHADFSNNTINEISPDFFKYMNKLTYPTIDFTNNNLTCDCDWVIQYLEQYSFHHSVQVLGKCNAGNETHELQQLPHYDIEGLVTHLGCTKCSQHLCSFRGECQTTQNSTNEFKCKCKPSFTGTYCQEAMPFCYGTTNTGKCTLCIDNYCQNGGQCFETVLAGSPKVQAFCRCRHGFDGKNCEVKLGPTNICKTNNPCSNNATCIDGSTEHNYHNDLIHDEYATDGTILNQNGSVIVHDAICQCQHGYTGGHCQHEELMRCNAQVKCSDHGTCVHSFATDQDTCYCDKGWEGKTCYNMVSSSKESKKLSASSIAVIVLALLLVLVIAILVFIIRKHRICKSKFHDDDELRYELGNDF